MKSRLLLIPMIVALALFCTSCEGLRATLIGWFAPDYSPEGTITDLEPKFTGADEDRKKIKVQLAEVATGYPQVTEMAFHPSSDRHLYITQKGGKFSIVDLATNKATEILSLKVPVVSEQGLLGFAFHPDFLKNGYIFLNYSVEDGERRYSRVSRWTVEHPDDAGDPGELKDELVYLEVDQPYQNHNAGRLAFGPDGMLYIGWGDGGWRADPNKNGQNSLTVLGAMLRIDVNKADGEKPYSIPEDNPYFTDKPGWAREVWAIGLRNPWKYSFDPKGRLIVADVGQDKYEEVSIVGKSQNMGWNTTEGFHCFEPESGCNKTGIT
ncbi:MAG: PQQ-dependent sugar dehydrogenase, partial [Leptospiraceae bacterium]|nr:PQQ-dependent sugar dehydrogenase [Leptospiraceae bacterium]